MSGQLERYETANEFYQVSNKSCTEEKANQSLRNVQNLQEPVRSPHQLNPISHPPVSNQSGQILGVRNLTNSLGQSVMPCKELKSENPRENNKIADRSNMELNLNLHDGTAIVKKSVKGVKLIGMEGPSLQVN